MFFNIIFDRNISYKFNDSNVDGRRCVVQASLVPVHVLRWDDSDDSCVFRRHPVGALRELGPGARGPSMVVHLYMSSHKSPQVSLHFYFFKLQLFYVYRYMICGRGV